MNKNLIGIVADSNWTAEEVEVIHSVDELTKFPDLEGDIFIIGGAEIYKLFLPHMKELIVTHVRINYEGDTYFPDYRNYFRKSTQIMKEDDFYVAKYF